MNMSQEAFGIVENVAGDRDAGTRAETDHLVI
jgi:hypothetical protein